MKFIKRAFLCTLCSLLFFSSVSCGTESSSDVTITISWWGGDSRHQATQDAIDAFMLKNPDINVKTQFGAWDGWESRMTTALYAGTAADINQINWNWITEFSSDGSVFLDLNTVSESLDLSQYDDDILQKCTASGELQAIPVSLTGRIFFWNKAVFEKAGLDVPTSMNELIDAGKVFREKLGEDFYPLALGEYDRMILMVYYLESVYGKPWIENGELCYSKEEIEKGLSFIQWLEESHVIPTIRHMLGDGAASIDKSSSWINGEYGGIFEWDTSAAKYADALPDKTALVVGDYFHDFGKYHGGFSKVSLAFAVSENTRYPKECAMLLEFLLNSAEGTAIMADERGIPLSKSAYKTCESGGLLDEMSSLAYERITAWTSFPLDASFEDASLKGEPDGCYFDVMSGLSYGDYDIARAAELLCEGIERVSRKQ